MRFYTSSRYCIITSSQHLTAFLLRPLPPASRIKYLLPLHCSNIYQFHSAPVQSTLAYILYKTMIFAVFLFFPSYFSPSRLTTLTHYYTFLALFGHFYHFITLVHYPTAQLHSCQPLYFCPLPRLKTHHALLYFILLLHHCATAAPYYLAALFSIAYIPDKILLPLHCANIYQSHHAPTRSTLTCILYKTMIFIIFLILPSCFSLSFFISLVGHCSTSLSCDQFFCFYTVLYYSTILLSKCCVIAFCPSPRF